MGKRTNDYYGCFADQDYDDDQEALFAKHVEEHTDLADDNCFWCILARENDDDRDKSY